MHKNVVVLNNAGLAGGENHIGEIGGHANKVIVEFTRPNDAAPYIAGDVVSNSTSASTIQNIPNFARTTGGTGYITGLRIVTDKKSITPRIRVHFYNTNTATVAVDNAPQIEKYADISKYLGFLDLPTMTTATDVTNSDCSQAQDMTLRHPFLTADTRSIYFILTTLDAFTPSALQKFTLVVYGDMN